jgi:hypothetical protein
MSGERSDPGAAWDQLDDRIIAALPIPATPAVITPARKTIAAVTALEDYCTATIQGTRPGIRLGIPALDLATRGVHPGELWLDLGRTDSLKTMAYFARLLGLLERYPEMAWLVVNAELPAYQMVERLARMFLGVTQRELEALVRAESGRHLSTSLHRQAR